MRVYCFERSPDRIPVILPGNFLKAQNCVFGIAVCSGAVYRCGTKKLSDLCRLGRVGLDVEQRYRTIIIHPQSFKKVAQDRIYSPLATWGRLNRGLYSNFASDHLRSNWCRVLVELKCPAQEIQTFNLSNCIIKAAPIQTDQSV